MKRFLNTIMLLAIGCIASLADDKLYIPDFYMVPGEQKTVEIILDNETPISSLQFDMFFPEGLEYVDGSLAKVTERITRSSHSTMAVDNNGYIRFGVLSTAANPANSAIKGNSGAILTIDIKAGDNFNGGSILINNIIGSNATVAEPVRVDMASSTASVAIDPGHFALEDTLAEVCPNVPMLINVSLANNLNLVGMQANVTLPNGVDFNKGENGEVAVLGDRLSENVTVSIEPVDGKENTFLLNISSPNKELFKGNDGVLFGLNIIADGTKPDGDVVIDNIKVTTPAGQQYDLKDVLNYTVKCYTDPSGDGVVDIDDVINLHEVIKGVADNPYADVNSDGVVDIDDIYALYSLMKK